ncbi:transcriptional regulator [Polycladidibacter hongkongensis]|uniref:transcriptional regulator n=1 Tax=Polycladidibacter hongkongensis TaxID=1647556 RepID=UPI00082DEE75|nr:transcriptional regulator [Pseudovibrio hongkongensis]
MKQPAESESAQVSARLAWLRSHYSLEIKDMAADIDASYTQMINWLTGTQRLSLKGALAISTTYGISLDFLFLGRVESLPPELARSWMAFSRAKDAAQQ